jgi:DNA-binding PadR family transcriptional regulator
MELRVWARAKLSLDDCRYTTYRLQTVTPRRDPQPLLPLTPGVFQVLVALADEERHGYALLRAVEQQTNGRVRLSTGTLYGIINRLLADDVIAERTSREGRRLYRLTAFGRALARAEADRLESLLAAARATRALGRPSEA